MTDSSRLVMTQGPQPGQTFVLDQDLLTLGRDPNNIIVINDPQISRHHARVTRQGDWMVLEDIGSTNGTFVNGIRLAKPHTLANGDVVGLGDAVTLTFYGASPAMTEPLAGRATAQPGEPGYEPPPSPPPPRYEPQPPPPSTYAAPPSPAYAVPPAQPAQPIEEKKSRTWVWVGCGCLILLVIVACGAVFVLDYLRMLPPIFYEPLRWLGLI
jgi:predicted component of type VI protein secretion system